MSGISNSVWLAGVDGCPGGWVVVFARPAGIVAPARVVETFAEIAMGPENPAVIAIDVPIGLPDRSPPKGRLPESAVRPLLGDRKSSVFRIPSRPALDASIASEPADDRERFLRACEIARETSDDHKAFAKQGFYILDKVAEVDRFLRSNRNYVPSVYETHPELGFWRLNGDQPLSDPKKVKSRCHEPGLALRRKLLISEGLPPAIVNAPAPEGAGPDDLLDALVCVAIARRIHAGKAKSFPERFECDSYGLPMAIWA
jgi:predicted RNase H-like nuclease